MGLWEFIDEKFISAPYYTPEATIVYGMLLVTAVWLSYKYVIKKLGVRVDGAFVRAIVPFIVFGALARSVGDVIRSTTPDSILVRVFITPGVYILLFAITLATLFAAVKLERANKTPYWKTMVGVGAALSIVTFAFLLSVGIPNWKGAALALFIAALWAPVVYALSRALPKYLTRENAALLWAHLFDASATFTALAFHTGLFEEHVLPRFLIHTLGLGPGVMFALKLAVVWPVLYYIDKDVKDPEYRTWLKVVVLVLGLALGIRDVMAIGLLGVPNF